MSKFIYRSGIFLVPLFIIVFFIESGLKKVNTIYSVKKDYLDQYSDSIQTLILGSSQAAYGIDPANFDKVTFNLASPSQSLYYDTRLTLQYIDKMKSLQYVVITISYFSLGYQITDGQEAWRDFYYYQFWNERYPETNRFDFRNFSKISLYQPDSSFRYLTLGFRVNLEQRLQPNGFFRMDTVGSGKNISDSLGKERVLFHTTFFQEKRIHENVEDLEKIITELKRRNIEPILITCPLFETYYKFTDQRRLKNNKMIIDMICRKYQCKYIDYSKDDRFKKNDFLDNDHLNFIGADKFSKILNEEIL